MSWHVEDWGTTKGTAGTLGWTESTGGGWNAGAWNWQIDSTGTRFGLSPTGVALIGAFGQTGPSDFQSGTGAFTGSQWHVGSAFNQTAGIYDMLLSKIASVNGTEWFFGGGCIYTGAWSFQFQTLRRIGTAGTFTVGTLANISNAGAWPNQIVRFDITHEGGGSWSGTVTNYTTGSVGTYSVGLGADYTPTTLDAPTVGIFSYSSGYFIMQSAFEYEPPPPTESILRYIGTWATGSGTYQWGGDLLGDPGDIQDRAYGPDDTAGWASTVGVTIDNSAGQWGSFAGTGQTIYDGLWNLRQYWSGIGTGTALGSWVDLFTGHLEPDGITYDYARKQARLTLQSTIARAAQTVARMDGTSISSRGVDIPNHQRLLGTITYADADTGTIRVGNVGDTFWEADNGCYLWGTSGTSTTSVRVGSSITASGAEIQGGTGTLRIEGDFPSWLAAGNEIWLTRAWPNYEARNRTMSAYHYVDAILGDMPALSWTGDNVTAFKKQAAYGAIAPNDRLYGDEKLTTALGGIMRAVNGFYSVDPTGQFRAFCLIPQLSVSGTVDFNAAFDSDWQMSYEPAYSQVEVDCSYNVDAGSFTEHVSVGGSQTWGEVKKYELKWLGSGIEAQSMAGRLYRNAYLPRPSLTLRLAGSAWATYLPGEVYAIHNLPAQVTSLLAGTQMILYSRTYDWADDLTAFEFVAMPGGNYAVWDGTPADYWEGSGKVWF